MHSLSPPYDAEYPLNSSGGTTLTKKSTLRRVFIAGREAKARGSEPTAHQGTARPDLSNPVNTDGARTRQFAASHDMKVKDEIERLSKEYGKLKEPWVFRSK